jgi:SAM-dependent methyltransferase
MIYPNAAAEGSGAARLLGCYEASLAPIFAHIIDSDYTQIIDVGCAEGYYAVGLARRMPNARIIARDASSDALALCEKLAADNGVSDRVTTGGIMNHADFDLCNTAKTLVICDIEGAEATVLDPALARGLLAADILVETHDCLTPGLSTLIANRFAASHHIRRIDRAINSAALPAWMEGLSDLDRLLPLWEWRRGPTPWLWMTRKEI